MSSLAPMWLLASVLATDPPSADATAVATSKGPPPPCVTQTSEVPGLEGDDPRVRSKHLIVVRKADRVVQLFTQGQAVAGAGMAERACYRVGLGFGATSHKQREGDGRTPEGWYTTSDKPWSSFYAALAVHYPNIDDARAGAADGRIDKATLASIEAAQRAGRKPPQTTPLGGEILLHGGGSSTDWTLGCIALDNADIDDLRSHLPKNMQVQIRVLP